MEKNSLRRKTTSKLLAMYNMALITEEELVEVLSQKTYSPRRDTRIFMSDPWSEIKAAYDDGTLTAEQYEKIKEESFVEHEQSFNIDFNSHGVGRTVTKSLPAGSGYRKGDMVSLHQNSETITGKGRIVVVDEQRNLLSVKVIFAEDPEEF